MAETTSVLASPPVSEADLARVEEFTREAFVHEGEDPAVVLADDSPRRRAFEDALAEIEAGREVPSVGWRGEYSLMLGLERLLSQEEPHLADGTVLSSHQVDALSGTLIALLAETQAAARNGNGNGRVELEDLPSGELEIEGDEDLTEDDEPLDWDASEEEEEERAEADRAAIEDPNAARRFWFEHATGAGKTVAALGFVEASRTGGVLILTHRRNLVDQFNGELFDRGYKNRVSPALLRGQGADRAASVRAHPAGRRRAHDRQGAAAPRRGGPGLRSGRAGRTARPGSVQRRRCGPLPRALQGPSGRRVRRRREARIQRREGVPGR